LPRPPVTRRWAAEFVAITSARRFDGGTRLSTVRERFSTEADMTLGYRRHGVLVSSNHLGLMIGQIEKCNEPS
jgi:hypothetical protein